ncbi:MAG: hypothetical protein K8L99_25190 [Anaerolineae bacterium]|nr:hypothetical protein [Anaerolineae bacterium]
MNRRDYISASEVGEYFYCQRAWWYRLRGVKRTDQEQERLQAGAEHHETFHGEMDRSQRLKRLAPWLLISAAALLLLYLLLQLIGGG